MIVIPMAGLSRRFAEAGYNVPKYMLPLAGRSVFAHAVGSFTRYFGTETFLFIARDVADTAGFIATECSRLGIVHARTAWLDAPSAGQAETVALGLDQIRYDPAEPVTIFNIDTFRPGFHLPEPGWRGSAGFLETFRGTGANWSYVRPQPGEAEPLVAETAEKRPISDLCCTGLYHFARAELFQAALLAERRRPSMPELYVAPLYNHLIAAGHRIHHTIIAAETVIFCGVPAEYEALRSGSPPFSAAGPA